MVIGGGLAGLVAAHRLKRAGVAVTLLEAHTLGGKLGRLTLGGDALDLGPNTVLESNPEIAGLIDDLGLRSRFLQADESANRRFVLRNGSLEPFPMSPPAMLKSKLLSPMGKVRALLELGVGKPTGAEETVAQLIQRRFGCEVLEYALDPFLIGTYAARPEDLSSRHVLAVLGQLEAKHGSVLRGAIGMMRARRKTAPAPKTHSGKLFAFPNGLSELTDALRANLEADLLEGARVVRLESGRVTYVKDGKTHTVEVDQIVVATPADVTAELLQGIAPETSSALETVRFSAVAQVFLRFPKGSPGIPKGFGVLVPRLEGRRILGAVFNSSIFPSRYTGEVVTVFVGGTRQPELLEQTDDNLIAMALEELRVMLPELGSASESAVESTVRRWAQGIPIYGLGYSRVLEAATQFEALHPTIKLIGNWRGGIGVPDTVKNAFNTAKTLIAELEEVRA